MTIPADHGQIKLETTAEDRAVVLMHLRDLANDLLHEAEPILRDINTLLARSLAVEKAVLEERRQAVAYLTYCAGVLKHSRVALMNAARDLSDGEHLADEFRSRPSVPVTDTEPEAK
jgi:hypothetical protein